MRNPLVEIDALPEPLRHRARHSVAAVQAYGGKKERAARVTTGLPGMIRLSAGKDVEWRKLSGV
jgi:hypothetical protein